MHVRLTALLLGLELDFSVFTLELGVLRHSILSNSTSILIPRDERETSLTSNSPSRFHDSKSQRQGSKETKRVTI